MIAFLRQHASTLNVLRALLAAGVAANLVQEVGFGRVAAWLYGVIAALFFVTVAVWVDRSRRCLD